MSHRVERFASTLQQCLADIILNDIDNPDLRFVSIARVDVSPDLKNANVFISDPLGMVENPIQKLNRAKGFIKKRLSRKMVLKYMPELMFVEYEYNDSGKTESIDDE
jgi:ribosome-binding factor A